MNVISRTVLNENPEFSKLLISLKSLLNKDGLDIQQHNRSKELEYKLIEKRKEYFKRKLLQDTLFELITGIKGCKINQEDFRNAYVDTDIYDNLSRAGFKDEDFLKPSISKPHKIKRWDQVRQDIEENLGMELAGLANSLHHFYADITGRDRDEFAVEDLSRCLQGDLMVLQGLKEALVEKQEMLQVALAKYLETLSSATGLTVDLLQTHLLSNLPQNVAIEVDYIDKQVQALALKLNNTQMSLLSDTYSKDAIKVLHYINKELTQEIQKTKSEEMSLESLLASYQSIGPEFSEMLEKYSKLKDEIENKKWALNEVKKSKI